MAPVMKLTLRWEEGPEELHTTLKIKLPRKWKEGPTLNLKETFVENYNAKHPDNKLELDNIHLLTPKGISLADQAIVLKVLNPSDTVRVKPGPPPSLDVNVSESKSTATTSSKPQKNEGHVTTAAALQEAAQAPAHAFDYSKWDRLDLSDDDGEDCHPNIDLASWKRLRGRQREERREKEEQKIAKYKAKIEKYSRKVEEIQEKIDGGDDDPQLIVNLTDAKDSKKEYEKKLQNFYDTRKMTADDVCETRESKGIVVKQEVEPDVPAMNPTSPHEEANSYDTFSKANREYLIQFAALTSDEASEEFLLLHPQLLCDHAEGFLLLLTLDACMKHQLDTSERSKKKLEDEAKKEMQVGRQHLTLHYITELAKSLRRDPRDAVKPFFRKTGRKSQDKVEGFEEDLTNFLVRIRNRAKEKIANGETSPLVDVPENAGDEEEEEEYVPAGLGPGGLDPNEVLGTLPEEIQEAFVEQDTDKLRAGFDKLSDEDAQYHLKRCIDSGLWVPAGKPEEEQTEETEAAQE
mmetsp:Transcript_25231/g.30795  ORF Transcript_25231/g.30795 Transcript_25231/m.30795 type:complete len:520 (+) Transcript_25231:142-1701(+)|eukprot:CAMPEP_0204823122 /NCGR_PEP_ID=MMETSP1346-20131115/1247_1 /ASSEMBLY_ACC=CAM_ASM_000771 /TAXON_ID=215587 /ORGANISM="Aplanochytrium stocchinoi, Strain GSBS06" /LENGTH=519 /DNA_ID=CAMNT_0051949659 /DNA_START=47 /DNA_END=1606 /DNA_ORIENTATION=+